MIKVFVLLALILVAGCSPATVVDIPPDTSDIANDLCSELDGVKKLRVSTMCVKLGKVCTSEQETTMHVTCRKHDATIKSVVKWQRL